MGIAGVVAPSQSDRVDWREVGLFVAVTFAISWAIWMGLRTLSVPLMARTVLAMFGPFLAARAFDYRRGGRPGSLAEWIAAVRCSARSMALVCALLGAGLLVAMLAGLQGFRTLSGGALAEVGLAFPTLFTVYMLSAYGEEYGWRGFLYDRLAPLGPVKSALITAPIWGLWHSPAILLDGFNYPHHRVEGLGMMVVFAVPFSLILTWLRTNSGGVLAPAAAHATLDALAAVIALLTWHQAMVLSAPMGLAGMVPFALLACWVTFRARGRAAAVLTLPRAPRRAELAAAA